MQAYEKAYYYISRKRGKSILLGCVFVISLLVVLIGMRLLHSSEVSLEEIGKQSNSQITVFSNTESELITNETISKLSDEGNVNFINRTNEITTKVEGVEIGIGSNELKEDAEVTLQGFDDLAKDSMFARQITQLGEDTLELEWGEVFIHETLATFNGLEENDVITFQTEQGDEIIGTIKGIYTYLDPNMENEERMPSMYRFENLIFANLNWMDEFQEEIGYSGAHFYVVNPYIIEETRVGFAEVLKGSSFETGVLDATFRRMSQPLLQTANIVKMILGVSIAATIAIISLLLSLWGKERKKEAALLLSLGESRVSIIIQRILETFVIYILAIVIAFILSNILTPYVSNGLHLGQFEEMRQKSVSVSLSDDLFVGIVGLVILVISVIGSCVSVLRLVPRAIFSAID